MTLYELGMEYEAQCKELFKKIEQLRITLKEVDSNEAVILQRRIYSLCNDLVKCREIGARLKKYYDNI